MKKAIIVFMLMFIGLSGFAQTEKGKILLGIGTSVGFSDREGLVGLAFTRAKFEYEDGSTTEHSQNNFYISTKVGVFLIDNLAGGFDLSMSTSIGNISTSDFSLESKSNFFGGGPFLRYYLPLKRILPFAEVNSQFGRRNYSTQGSGITSEDKYSMYNIGGGLGIAVMLGQKSSLDLVANYSSVNFRESDRNYKSIQNTLGLKIGFTFFL